MDINDLSVLVGEIEDIILEAKKDLEPKLELEHEIIKDAITQQLKLQIEWEKHLAFVNASFYETEVYMESAYSKAVENNLTNKNIDYSISEAKIIAQHDRNYIDVKLLYNRLLVVKREVEGVLKTVDSRKWLLKSLTDLILQGSESEII